MNRLSKPLITLLIGGTALLYACGGSEGSTTSTESSTAAAMEEVSSVADPNAKSDSKGIGRFTSVELAPVDDALAAKGDAIFTSKCAACHKTTEDKVVGPGLKHVTERRTPEWIMNMITNPEEMTKKDPVAKALFEQHLVQMTFQNVSDDETKEILEFLRKNDAQ